VKEPGPWPNASASTEESSIPASARSSSTIGNTRSVCRRAPGSNFSNTAPSCHSATEQASVAVSMATIRVIGWLLPRRRLSRCGGTRSAIPDVIEKTFHHLQLAGAGHARQAVDEHAPVALAEQARIRHHQQAGVLRIADQTAGALTQGQHRLGQLVITKGVTAVAIDVLDAGRRHRITRRRERQLVDYDTAQRIASHINAFPETAGAKQHRIAQTPELIQQFPATGLALHQQRIAQA